MQATTKIAKVQKLIARPKGASISEIAKATGWQPHSIRAAISGLRKSGHTIERDSQGKTTVYRLAVDAS